METSHALVIPPARDFGIPVINRTAHHHDWRHRHHHVEMSNHKKRIRQRHADCGVTKEKSRHAAIDKEQQECDRKEHGYGKVDISSPKGQNPVVNL